MLATAFSEIATQPTSSRQQAMQQQRSYDQHQQHSWADDLIDIVHEPMDQTLSRMRRFSNSLSNVEKSGG